MRGWDMFTDMAIEEVARADRALLRAGRSCHRSGTSSRALRYRREDFFIFEPHTELIKRGRVRTPVEFGHKVTLWRKRGGPDHAIRRQSARRVHVSPSGVTGGVGPGSGLWLGSRLLQ